MNRRYLPILIAVVTLLAVLVDLGPRIPVNISLGPLQINQTFEKPLLDINLLGTRLVRDWEFKEGLDLAGGTHLVLSADISKVASGDRDTSLEALKGIVERRINFLGVSEPIVQTAKTGGDYRLIVEIAGVTNVDQAIGLVGQTAQLTFREEIIGTPSAEIATEAAILYGPFQIETNLSGSDLKRAAPAFDQQTGQPIIQLEFTADGAKKFEELTKKNLGRRLAIFLDQAPLMEPTVQSVISGGQAVITGQFTAEQTKQISLLLNSGALPAPVKIIEQRTVGATLGDESVRKSVIAGLIGLVVIGGFMIGNYRFFGILASIALVVYILVSLAIFKLVPVTLTLAGIAGFILSVGMAVDANILIFERIKEEIRWGRTKAAALELGFSRAFPSIRDSNFSSLITCGILYWFGSGSVRGFAVTLGLGIVVSLFSSITVTRTLLRAFSK